MEIIPDYFVIRGIKAQFLKQYQKISMQVNNAKIGTKIKFISNNFLIK